MAMTAAQKTDAYRFFAIAFNAAPGATYMSQLFDAYTAGMTTQQIVNVYTTKPEFTATYPVFLSDTDFATKLVNNIVKASASTTNKAAAVADIVASLALGQTRGDVIYTIFNNLANKALTDADWGATAKQMANQVTVSQYYTETLIGNTTTLSTLQGVIANVTDTTDVSTAAAIEAAIGGTSGVGQTFTLTVNQDSGSAFTGGTSNDTFNASTSQDGAGNLINTLQTVDVLDGGAGTDTLNATLAQAATVSATIKNIENVSVRFADAGAVLDLANASGLTAVTAADGATAGTLKNIGALANLTIKNSKSNLSLDGTASSATTLALNLDTVGTGAAAITLDLGVANAAKATTATITAKNAFVTINSTQADVLTTATIAATGSNALTFADSKGSLTKVTITGAGDLDLTGGALAKVTTFDGSASTGAISAELTESAKAVTITTGGGADVIDADAVATALSSANLGGGNDTLFTGANLGAFDKGVNGGDGTDIISVTDGSKLDATTAKYVTNFETLDVSGGKGNYDVSLNSFATVQIDEAIAGALAANVDFKNAADTFTLTVASKARTNADFAVGKTITVTGKDYTGTTAKGDAETFSLVATIKDANKDSASDGNIAANTVTVAGVEKLVVMANVASTDGGTTAVKSSAYSLTAKFVATEAETITISGDAKVDLSSATTIGVVTKIDATGSTGGTSIDLSTHAKSVAFTGGDGVDTYKGSTKGDVIYTGKGADVVTLEAGKAARDTYVLKAGTDSQVTDTSKDTKITLGADTGFDSITNFKTGALSTDDRLDLTNFSFSGAQRGVVDANAKVVAATDLTSITALFNDPAGNRGVAISNLGGADTYVFIDANKDGNFTAADDIVIKLVGIATISETNINF